MDIGTDERKVEKKLNKYSRNLYFYTTLEYVYMSMIISSCSPRYASARLFLLGIMWDGVDEDYCSNHSISVYVRNTRPKEHALT